MTNKVIAVPAPLRPCPSEADEDRLAELLPQPADAVLAGEIDDLGERFIAAGVYCRRAARWLE